MGKEVSEMNMPGFTAEASLYKTSECYHIAGTRDQADGTVHPAYGIKNVKNALLIYDIFRGLFSTYGCCSQCKRDCYKVCTTSVCIDYCLKGCTSKCDAYWIGGCP